MPTENSLVRSRFCHTLGLAWCDTSLSSTIFTNVPIDVHDVVGTHRAPVLVEWKKGWMVRCARSDCPFRARQAGVRRPCSTVGPSAHGERSASRSFACVTSPVPNRTPIDVDEKPFEVAFKGRSETRTA